MVHSQPFNSTVLSIQNYKKKAKTTLFNTQPLFLMVKPIGLLLLAMTKLSHQLLATPLLQFYESAWSYCRISNHKYKCAAHFYIFKTKKHWKFVQVLHYHLVNLPKFFYQPASAHATKCKSPVPYLSNNTSLENFCHWRHIYYLLKCKSPVPYLANNTYITWKFPPLTSYYHLLTIF